MTTETEPLIPPADAAYQAATKRLRGLVHQAAKLADWHRSATERLAFADPTAAAAHQAKRAELEHKQAECVAAIERQRELVRAMEKAHVDVIARENYPAHKAAIGSALLALAIECGLCDRNDLSSTETATEDSDMARLEATTQWLDAKTSANAIGVDRKNAAIRGYVVAQAGYFKSEGRGQFTRDSLDKIAALGNAERKGLKSRFTHPTLSSDGLGKFLGRAKNFRMDQARDARTGRPVDAVRADLFFDETALREPPEGGRPLGEYILHLAESDPDALSSSLVLKPNHIEVLDDRGRPKKDADGNDVPPIWMPVELHSSDLVDVGDAVDSLLSAGVRDGYDLPDHAVRMGSDLLRRAFRDAPREVAEVRAHAFLKRVLDSHYGEPRRVPELEQYRRRLDALDRPTDADRRRLAGLAR